MPLQPRPTAALVVAQSQFLLAVLMKPLHAPAPMRQPRLIGQGAAIQPAGEVPFRLARRARQGTFPEQPAGGAGALSVSALDAHPTGQPLRRLSLLIEHPHTLPAPRR